MNKPTLVYRTAGMLDGQTVQILLESFGIPSNVIPESAGVAIGLTAGGLGSANVYVAEDNAEEALKIIQAMENGELTIEDQPGDDFISLDDEV